MARPKKTTAKKPAAKKPAAKKPAAKKLTAGSSAKKPASRPPAKAPIASATAARPSARGAKAARKPAPQPEATESPGLSRKDRPPPEVTRDLFLVWRAPRVGMGNPQRLTNPVWSWLARRREINAYQANKHFGGPSSVWVGPCWCCQRFGQSSSTLADGRVISIGGEHEDYYDADFYIYNDVIVADPSGGVEIYGYPHEVFPPTDFHSATVVGNRIIIIGCLGYTSRRMPGVTPVFSLDTGTFAITRLTTMGAPGWIYKHQAELSADQRSIVVRGGRRAVLGEGGEEHRENWDDWSLDLEKLRWTPLTERLWQEWELGRADGTPNNLMQIEWMSWSAGRKTPFDLERLAELETELGYTPDFEVHAARYTPPLEHKKLPPLDDEHRTARLVIDGVTVRYTEGSHAVRITIEGSLPQGKAELLVEDARRKLEALEKCPWKARLLRG